MNNEIQQTTDTSREYEARLVLYHPSMKGTGSAIQVSMNPATSQQDGCIFLAIAAQSETGAGATADQPKRFASFDWANRIVVKIGFFEICEILRVLAGVSTSLTHAGKNGLFHTTESANTSIELKRSEDATRPGYVLFVTKTMKADGSKRNLMFFMNPSEALGLRLAMEQSMGYLAFGVPRHRRSGSSGQRIAGGDAVGELGYPGTGTAFDGVSFETTGSGR